MASLAARIEAATPGSRDRGVDALRALAIVGVVLGHWLVTAWDLGAAGAVHISSPLAYLPELTPMSWVFQTLAVFFLVGGYAAARGLRSSAGAWVRARTGRLLGPVVPLLLVWAGIAAGMALRGSSAGTIRVMVLPAIGPLWFLAVFAALTAATPLLLRANPVATAAAAFAVVLGVDLARFGLGAPAWTGWANLAAGWLVPYALGIA
ncbi:acyltransferase family protein [Streptosporangium sp. NPDC048865]|uniref:acyltransferase family protein n=1 Tax=Streptosporangium sp. NPDC048865 TaxID=3155766 RepID=UPI0034298AC8